MGLPNLMRFLAEYSTSSVEAEEPNAQDNSASELLARLDTLQARVRELEARHTLERNSYRAIIAKMASSCRSHQCRIAWLENRRLPTEVNKPVHNVRRCITWPVELSRRQQTLHTPPTLYASSPFIVSSIKVHPVSDKWPYADTIVDNNGRDALVYDDEALLSKALLWF
ncbi:hypothetical protein BDY19DRAFT_995855 [Irpex rosettiformis]|uniref:Uncharacterized protein n=1 Tax=Irpex rosettiformis TaxID=378272 RepID=A0ACB8TWZ0_9APHY|nr:hypothetical protein BDY19DRAFT_995855 [Irpex rosettiformis]